MADNRVVEELMGMVKIATLSAEISALRNAEDDQGGSDA